MSLNKMMDEFNKQYGIEPVSITPLNVEKAANFAKAESEEALEETQLSTFSPENSVKELLDVIYATSQQLRGMGVDIDLGLSELHTSNMSKLVPYEELAKEIHIARERYFDVEAIEVEKDLFRLYSPSQNKVVKPTCYRPANVKGALPEHEQTTFDTMLKL